MFSHILREARAPVALVTPDALLTNALAAGILSAADRAAVWSEVSDALRSGSTSSVTVRLSGGRTIDTRFAAVREGTRVVGALVRVAEAADLGAPPRRAVRRRGADHARFGWGSLTPTELLVAGLAVQGRTNREIADALTMSPHTVDSHVRHIYGKLGIASRIELTRVVLAH